MGISAHEALDRLMHARDNGVIEVALEPLNVDLLSVFGSVLRTNTSQVPHDLDLGARFSGDADLIALIDALTRITGYDRIDVAVITGQHPVLDAEALCGIPLYERTAGLFAEAQMAALAHRRDTAFMRELDLSALARSPQ